MCYSFQGSNVLKSLFSIMLLIMMGVIFLKLLIISSFFFLISCRCPQLEHTRLLMAIGVPHCLHFFLPGLSRAGVFPAEALEFLLALFFAIYASELKRL